MPQVDRHAPGTFCWTDLSTTDTAAAKAFYSALFGWTVADVPIGNGLFYSMLMKNGLNAAALAQISPDEQAMGIPPHWTCYVCVEDADAVVENVKGAGGSVLVAPMDVFNSGRFAMCRDAADAVFGLWQPREHIGAGIAWEASTICWFELQTRNRPKARDFYASVFGWESKGDDTYYTEFLAGGKSFAGMMEIAPEWGPVPANWSVYFMVENCDESAARAVELGAKTLVPPQDIPDTGRFSVLQDPQGAVFCIFRPSMKL